MNRHFESVCTETLGNGVIGILFLTLAGGLAPERAVWAQTAAASVHPAEQRQQDTLERSGSGYNGPQTSGVSIPLSMDRGVLWQDIEGAIDRCLVLGDESRGLTSLFQRVYHQVYGRLPRRKTALPDMLDIYGELRLLYHGNYDYMGITRDYKTPSIGGMLVAYRSHGKYGGILSHYSGKAKRVYRPYAGMGREGWYAAFRTRENTEVAITVPGGLPYIEAGESSMEYDSWGANGQRRYTRLRVVSTIPLSADVQFVNAFSLVPVPLYANTIEYAQCLQSEIQRAPAR